MTAVKQKYIDKGLTFLDGSYSAGSYLLFAQHPETGGRLGVRVLTAPLMTGKGPVIMITLRMRLMPAGADVLQLEEGGTPEGFPAKDNWQSSFPEMKWVKSSDVRRSLIVGVALSRSPEDAWMAPYDLDKVDFWGQVESWLMSRMPRKAWAVTPDTFRQYLKDQLAEVFGDCKPPVPEPAVTLLAMVRSQIAALEEQEATLQKKVDSGVVEPSPADLVTGIPHAIATLTHYDDLPALLEGSSKPSLTVHQGGLVDDDENDEGDGDNGGGD